MRPTYDIHVAGVEADDMPLGLLRDLCDILLEGSQRAARLAVEGRSTGRGPQPNRLSGLSDVRVSGYRPGSLQLAVTAPRLRDALPELAAQQNMFAELLSPDLTAMDLLLQAAGDAVAGKQDSERLDPGVLDVLARANTLFARGVTELRFQGRGQDLRIDALQAEGIKRLREQTPNLRVARIQGTLDTVTVSTNSFVLRLADGTGLRGLAVGQASDLLAALIGRNVVVEGSVYYKPSRQPLRIEADYIAAAQASDQLWTHLPRVDTGGRNMSLPGADIASVFGKWPGDESEEEIFAALEEMS